ncbi:T7SS effector LXG polymorphic toxin [Bacillus sp. GX]|uniref:T7SS effector LXG polymorphic toxin n=1 Tax=Bacillus sp. GX TaxID=3382157 RepID=UPI0038CC1117
MDKNIELQEVDELQKRFQTSADELNQYFETLLGKIDDLNQLNSFQGKAADEIKRYFSRVHGTTIAGFQIAAEELKNEFQKAIESFNSTVDSDSDTKIYGNYLDNVKKKINGYSNKFDRSNEEAKQTISTIADIVPTQYPSSSGISEGIQKSQKEISDTLEKLETYNSQQNELQHFNEMLSSLDKGMKEIQAANGDFSSKIVEKIMAGGWNGNLINGISNHMTAFDIQQKGTKFLIAAFARMYYAKKNYDFKAIFDPDSRKGKGKFTLSTRQKEDLVEVFKLLKMDSSDDSIFRYVKNGLKMDGVENSRITNEQVRKARKGIYKLPEFQDFHKFHQDRSQNGLTTAIKERGWSSFKTEYVKGLKDLHPGKWKEAFKELGKTGKFLKGAAIFGAVVSVGNNIAEAQKNGWQREDIVDIATDSAVDIGATAGAAAAGAVAGSFFVPPVGTVVGAGVAVFATAVMNYKWGGEDNAIDYAKKGVKQITKKIWSLF